MNKLKIALITLLAVTAIFTCVIAYCYIKVNEIPTGGLIFIATEIEKPDNYWVLTDPDPWVLEAVENPGTTVFCFEEDIAKTTFQKQASEHGSYNVEYQGKYYYIYVHSWHTYPPEIIDQPYKQNYEKVVTYSPAVFTVLGALWTALGIVWYRRRTENVVGC